VLIVDWAPHPAEGDKLLWVFDGGLMTDAEVAALQLDGDEIVEVRFHDPAELPNLMPARLARRLLLALEAAGAGTTVYAEHGTAVGAASRPA
jgi:hypothetical protein